MVATYFLYIENSLGVNLVEAYNSSCKEKQKSMLFYHINSLFVIVKVLPTEGFPMNGFAKCY